MEADWEIEIGGDAPVIDAAWAGLIDLRSHPERAAEVAEAALLPGLEDALRRLNASASPVWTSKCDVWDLTEFDPYEMEAGVDEAKHALACYLDLLPRDDRQWASPSNAVSACKLWCKRLSSVAKRNCRADFVVRRALLSASEDVGITAYLSACGSTRIAPRQVLSEVLAALVQAVAPA